MKKSFHFYTGSVVLFSLLLSACATQAQHLSTGAETTAVVSPDPFVNDIESQRFANWEKSHALYLHDLEFSKLNSEGKKANSAKADIVDARLYASYAEVDLIDLGKPDQAKKDLDKTRFFLSRAAAQLGPSYSDEVQSLANESVLKALGPKEQCDDPSFAQERARYEHLKADFDSLISML